eukprot:TRINITY_DN15504_c0_g1_i1.p3 TRINITY_DN15504_c0_g1~~TRINITY_DN15504_c0_g1_i1.p3  ORF type:complete len:119 (-),score=38.17 TRINITY_DN15504_c0_g1_i1:19-375(-)
MVRYIGTLVADCVKRGADKVLLDHRELMYGRKSVGTYDVALKAMEFLDPGHPMKVALLSRPERMEFAHAYESVSYTHLTLPTKRIVQISVGAGSLKKKRRNSRSKVKVTRQIELCALV